MTNVIEADFTPLEGGVADTDSEDEDNGQLLLVYGTLKKGQANHRYLAGAKYLGRAATDIDLTPVSMFGIPAVSNALGHDDAQAIICELYSVPPELFDVLSQAETSYGYLEVQIPWVSLENSEWGTANMWLYPVSPDLTTCSGWQSTKEGYSWSARA